MTGWGTPRPSPTPGCGLGGELTGVIEHYREDFTVRVGAGCTVGGLREALVVTNQWLPLDADDDLTLGECVNHNVYGPLRLRYGATRDLLLGLAFVSGEGEAIRVGGRTVKNVAGYDVTKLMVGSLGQLGILTEVTPRTYAIPEATVNVEMHLPDPTGVDELLPGWLTTDAAPVWLSLMGPEPGGATGRHGSAGAAGESTFTLRAGYHGGAAACLHQLRSLETLLDTQPGWHLASAQETDLEGDGRARAMGRVWRSDAATVVKVVVPPAATGFVVQALTTPPAGDPPRHLDALPAHGVLFVGGPLDADAARRLDQQIEHILQPVGGFRLWYRRPSEAFEHIPPHAPEPDDMKMMRKIKHACDPHGVLNPGRFL